MSNKQLTQSQPTNQEPQTSESRTDRIVRHTMFMNLPKLDFKSVEKVKERVGVYFDNCIVDGVKPTISGLCLALNISRKTLNYLVERQVDEYAVQQLKLTLTRDINEEVRGVIIQATQIINAQYESYLMEGQVNPVAGIFLMKNNFGYTDQQELVIAPKTDYDLSAEELLEEASHLPTEQDTEPKPKKKSKK